LPAFTPAWRVVTLRFVFLPPPPLLCRSPQALAQLVLLGAVMLYVCTAADMFYTAKYYHTPAETLSTVVVVFLLFQLPVLAWVQVKRAAALRA